MKTETLSKKLHALKLAVDHLETEPSDYSWNIGTVCNCGIVAQACGIGISDIADNIQGFWSKQQFCSSTNIPINNVIKTLRSNGFTAKDIRQLEYLKNRKYNKDLYKNINKEYSHCSFFANRNNVITYLKNWINDLESQLLQNVTVPTITKNTIVETVSCSVH